MTLADDIKRLAIGMAKSGRYVDCLAIEAQLADEGHPEVYVVLVDLEFRAILNQLCGQSRASAHSPLTPSS